MRFHGSLIFYLAPLTLAAFSLGAASAASQQSIEAEVHTIAESLVVLCMAGGAETVISTKGNLELREKIKDILTGNVGVSAAGGAEFNKKIWEGIVGGISKDMTDAQISQANEARKCMVENGFALIRNVLASH